MRRFLSWRQTPIFVYCRNGSGGSRVLRKLPALISSSFLYLIFLLGAFGLGVQGLSSSKNGEKGYCAALPEIHRTLAEDGALYAIKTEWVDVKKILDVFRAMNARTWDCFCEKQKTWHERLLENDFEIVFEQPFETRKFQAKDNEPGAADEQLSVDIHMYSIYRQK